jgi:hypothetical protein
MTYSCSDFTDDICRALNVTLPADADDGDVQVLAELALAEIERLKLRDGWLATAQEHGYWPKGGSVPVKSVTP